jgi:hypothetical protein
MPEAKNQRVKYIKLPWQKTFRSMPEAITQKFALLLGDVQVACVKKIKLSMLDGDSYKHLGFLGVDKTKDFSKSFVPNIEVGKTSRINMEGIERKRKDLPKISKEFCMESPNFGDSSKGYHEVCHDREIWQKEIEPPREYSIFVEKIEYDATSDLVVLKFKVEVCLDREDKNFDRELLFCINLLQENIGLSDIFDSEMSKEDFLSSILVEWEFLPSGTIDEVVEQISQKFKRITPQMIEKIRDRYEFISGLGHLGFVFDKNGMGRYFGAKFADNLVVFENIRYGNAMYVMYENWQELSQLTRLELLVRDARDFDKVVHKNGWKSKVKSIISKKLNNP